MPKITVEEVSRIEKCLNEAKSKMQEAARIVGEYDGENESRAWTLFDSTTNDIDDILDFIPNLRP